MAVVVERTSNIVSAPETVWGLLVNPAAWKTWWPDCVIAHAADFRTLREGSRIELVLQPRQRKLTLEPVVDLLTEGKTLSLTQQTAMLQGTVVWTVSEGPTGTRVGVRGVFKGLQVWLMGLAGRNDVFQLTLYGNLRGLKRMAERMA